MSGDATAVVSGPGVSCGVVDASALATAVAAAKA